MRDERLTLAPFTRKRNIAKAKMIITKKSIRTTIIIVVIVIISTYTLFIDSDASILYGSSYSDKNNSISQLRSKSVWSIHPLIQPQRSIPLCSCFCNTLFVWHGMFQCSQIVHIATAVVGHFDAFKVKFLHNAVNGLINIRSKPQSWVKPRLSIQEPFRITNHARCAICSAEQRHTTP